VYRAIGQVKSKKWVGCTLLFTFVAFCCAAWLLWFGCCALSIYFLLYALIVLGLVGGLVCSLLLCWWVIVAYGWYVLVKV
jgi:hypothetical protein